MSRLKKGLALVLTLCMMLSLMPVITPSAEAADNTISTRIFHLDCGRKYFSVDQIKALIDTLAANNYTHMELAVGNDGLRFLLDDMSVTANDTTYTSDAVKAGIQAGNKAYYNAGTYNELTQTEMDTIIEYADEKGIEIIPLINSPGHMDAILDCMESVGISSPAYNNSARTVDVTNTAAVDFTLALIDKYIQYFDSKGCAYFNMGCDEYANDLYENETGMGFGRLQSAGHYDEYITYVNAMAKQVTDVGMTPMAFNDGFYYGGVTNQGTFNDKIVIAYWTAGYGPNYLGVQSAATLVEKGHKIINTHENWYYVLGRASGTYGLTSAQSGVSGTACDKVNGASAGAVTPAGCMICLWCDTPSASYSSAEVSNVTGLISTFATNNSSYFVASTTDTDVSGPIDVYVTVGGTTTKTIEKTNCAGEIDGTDLDEDIATVSAEYKQDTSGTKEVKATSITSGSSYYIKNSSGRYLSSRATWVSDISSAALWTATSSGSGYTLKNGNNYLRYQYTSLSTTTKSGNATTWTFSNGTFSYAGVISSYTLGDAYTVTTTDPVDETIVTFTGVAVGTTYVTVGTTRYIIHVEDKAPDGALTSSTLSIVYRITNSTVYTSQSTSSASSATVNSSDATGEAGVSVADLVPETAYSNYDGWIELHYWQAMRQDANHNQSGTSSGEDQTGNGTTFTHVRYRNGAWQYKDTDNVWHYFQSGDQAVAYYMRHTEITKEITTAMKDWGYSTSSTTHDTSSNQGQVALTVAVVYPDGTVSPAESDMYANSTTIFNYNSNWNGSGKARDIGLIVPLNNSDYTISKITVTDGTRTDSTTSNTWSSNAQISWNKVTNEAGSEWYDETTYWEETDGGAPMINGATSDIRWSAKNTAKLVLIYLKPIQKDTNLNLVYWDDSANSQIASAQIVMSYKTGDPVPTYYSALKQTSALPAEGVGGTFILDDNAYVINSSNVNQTFNKNISTIPGVADQYKSGLYTYVSAELSGDGKTLTLHYNIDSSKLSKTYVIDFGLPVNIPISNLVEDTAGATITVSNGTYGAATYVNDTITYTPNSVLRATDTITVKLDYNTAQDQTIRVGIIPATTVYYEEGFAEYTGSWTGTDSKGTGTQTASAAGSKDNYGYDDKYAKEDNGPSNGTQATSSTASDTATFSFTGTGVDIYANCSPDTGAVMIKVKNSADNTVKAVQVVTALVKGSTDATEGQETTGYNVPIASITGLDHGSYTVEITHIRTSMTETDVQPVNLDGFRVYDTLAPGSSYHGTDGAYYKDLEDNPIFIELRDQVLDSLNVVAETSDSLLYTKQIAENTLSQIYSTAGAAEGKENGAAIISKPDTYTEETLKDLLDNGPKNEIYLQPNQALVFTVNTDRVVQVGLKALDATVNCTINGEAKTITTSTDMFYKLTGTTNGSVSVNITNTGSGILAVTKLKICDDPNAALGTLTADDLIPALVSLGYPAPEGENGSSGTETPANPETGLPFTDVGPGDWFLENVKYVYEKGLMNGTSDTTFSPKKTTNRAMIVTILHRLEGTPAPDAQAPFTDVPAGQYYAEAVAWAAANGIVNGTSDTTFAPLNNITREQMAAILYRYAQYKGYDVSGSADLSAFTDAASISDYAVSALQWAVDAGLINGKGNGILDPKGSATRAEVSAILSRFCENIAG